VEEGLIVKTDKNTFLLYSMLNALNLMRGSNDSHPIRKITYEHFKNYKGIGLSIHDYKHHSKAVAFVLTIDEPPTFSSRYNPSELKGIQYDLKYGKKVLKHLKHFYKNTDFENFYQEILPMYKKECDILKSVVENNNINELINTVWGVDGKFKMVVIPMPLEGRRAGIGPSISKTAYQIVGPPFDKYTLGNVIHEASHPRAKIVLSSLKEEINNLDHLFSIAKKHPNWPQSYGSWNSCFEEHLIRAVQLILIHPRINFGSYDELLESQVDKEGMVFLKDICEVIKQYKDSDYDVRSLVLEILNTLEDKYQALFIKTAK